MATTMTDPYKPALTTFLLTPSESAAVEAAMQTDKPWKEDNAEINSVKTKIRDLHLARQKSNCCYCRTNLHGGGHFMIDREHVLPKKAFKQYTFEIWNLSISCKRCNMEMKGERKHFVVDMGPTAAVQTSANYRIIHPNFDAWKDHLQRYQVQLTDDVVVKISLVEGSEKGQYTYDFFKLKDLDTDAFDVAQGNELLPSEDLGPGALEARLIARDLGQ